MKVVGGISAKNIRQVEQNLERWLAKREMTDVQRRVRNKTVGFVRRLVGKWKVALRTERSVRRRRLRNERAKARRSGR